MKRIAIVLAILMLILTVTGCRQNPFAGGDASSSDSSEESSSEASSSEESSSEESSSSEDPIAQGNWKKPVSIDMPWEAETKLSDTPAESLSIPAAEAEKLPIELSIVEEDHESFDTYEGGSRTEYSVISIEGDVPAGARQALEDYNAWAETTKNEELEQGVDRHAVYQNTDNERDFIMLTSWVSMKAARMDTQMVSFLEEVYRYNREYEPNYFEVHGVNLDAQTGRPITLNDLFTDVSRLPEMIWEGIQRDSWGIKEKSKGEMIGFIREAIEGSRDDGSFAWIVYPYGVEFWIVGTYEYEHKTYFHEYCATISFPECKEFLRDGISDVPYDYMWQITVKDVPSIMGVDAEKIEDMDLSYYGFIAQKSGKLFFYNCDDEYTTAYRAENGGLTAIETTVGELPYLFNNYAYMLLDPNNVELSAYINLWLEMNIKGTAKVTEDGRLERDGLFYLEYNSEPIYVGPPFETEVFKDREDDTPEKGEVAEHSDLTIIRTDGETFVDVENYDNDEVYRWYIGGNKEDGWTINGHPVDEVITHVGWWEE